MALFFESSVPPPSPSPGISFSRSSIVSPRSDTSTRIPSAIICGVPPRPPPPSPSPPFALPRIRSDRRASSSGIFGRVIVIMPWLRPASKMDSPPIFNVSSKMQSAIAPMAVPDGTPFLGRSMHRILSPSAFSSTAQLSCGARDRSGTLWMSSIQARKVWQGWDEPRGRRIETS